MTNAPAAPAAPATINLSSTMLDELRTIARQRHGDAAQTFEAKAYRVTPLRPGVAYTGAYVSSHTLRNRIDAMYRDAGAVKPHRFEVAVRVQRTTDRKARYVPIAHVPVPAEWTERDERVGDARRVGDALAAAIVEVLDVAPLAVGRPTIKRGARHISVELSVEVAEALTRKLAQPAAGNGSGSIERQLVNSIARERKLREALRRVTAIVRSVDE